VEKVEREKERVERENDSAIASAEAQVEKVEREKVRVEGEKKESGDCARGTPSQGRATGGETRGSHRKGDKRAGASGESGGACGVRAVAKGPGAQHRRVLCKVQHFPNRKAGEGVQSPG